MNIFVNGSFDVIHTGHLDLLNYAKSLGNKLIVGIDSDRRIKENKGNDRPFNNEENRFALMSNIKAVDEVYIFDSDDDLINIIRKCSPDIMVKGSDWKDEKIIGKEYIPTIIWFERKNDESTTKTIQNYLNRR